MHMHMHMSLGRRGLNSLGAPPRVETAPADGDDMQQPGAVLLTRGHRAERLGAAGDAHARSAPPFGGLRGRGAPHTAAAAGDVRVKDLRTLALTLTLTPIPALASAPALAMHIALALAPALALALALTRALALTLALTLPRPRAPPTRPARAGCGSVGASPPVPGSCCTPTGCRAVTT